jgi:hypothetical protein
MAKLHIPGAAGAVIKDGKGLYGNVIDPTGR